MLKLVATFTYTSASWARMLKVHEDRTKAVTALVEHFGGSLESIYWDVETASAHIIANLPDSVSATAVITAATRTGRFKEARVHEVLTEDQLHDMVSLARTSEGVYRAPGSAAFDEDDEHAHAATRSLPAPPPCWRATVQPWSSRVSASA